MREILALDPLGRFVFGGSDHVLDSYRVNRDGSLTFVAATPSAHRDYEWVFTEASGRFLYAAHDPSYATERTGESFYEIFAIEKNGRLTPTGKRTSLPANVLGFDTISLSN